jgi:hypothetical protein
MKLSKIVITLVLVLMSGVANTAERLSLKDYDKLVDLGYNKLDAYSDDYSKVKTRWYTLEEHLKLKPKFLGLLIQEMQINEKSQLNKHVYNSRHHIFASRDEKCGNDNKKLFQVLKKCKQLQMPVIEDENISIDNFAKLILDHCNETKVKNLKTLEGKKLKISQEKKCSIKFINFKRYEFAKVLKEVGNNNNTKKNKKSRYKKNFLDVFKKQCENLGFKPKTEKFGECVIRLAELSK